MMRILAVLAVAAIVAGAAIAAEATAERDVKLMGDATFYSGEMTDPGPPVAGGDARVFLNLTGKPAQRMFELMGKAADQRGGACPEPGVTVRRRGVLSCMKDAQGHACYLAYDLINGKAIDQSAC
jgi:hypothetical protein